MSKGPILFSKPSISPYIPVKWKSHLCRSPPTRWTSWEKHHVSIIMQCNCAHRVQNRKKFGIHHGWNIRNSWRTPYPNPLSDMSLMPEKVCQWLKGSCIPGSGFTRMLWLPTRPPGSCPPCALQPALFQVVCRSCTETYTSDVLRPLEGLPRHREAAWTPSECVLSVCSILTLRPKGEMLFSDHEPQVPAMKEKVLSCAAMTN